MSGKRLTYDIFLEASARGIQRAMQKSGQATQRFSKTVSRNVKEANKALARMSKTFAKVGAAAGIAATAGGVYAFTSVMKEAIQLANEQEKSEKKLGAVLKATGNAAGFNLQELKKMASEMQSVTTVGDDVILNGMALLATFKNVSGDGFKRATMAALDMSNVMDQDLKSSMIQLGKALNDPVKGMSALAEVGVSFTESQIEMVKALTEAGDMMGAQEIILKELESEFGGAAAAARDRFGGAVDAASNALGDLKEEIGFVITKNTFFVEIAKQAEQQFIRWTEEIKNNRAALMEQAKDAAIGLLTIADGAIAAADGIYRAFQGVNGLFKGTAAAALFVSGGIFKIVEAAAALTDALGITENAAASWGQEAEAAFGAADELAGEATDNFGKMIEGSKGLEKVSGQVDKLRQALEKIDAKEMDDVARETKKANQELVKVGDQWVNVSAAAIEEASKRNKEAVDSMVRGAGEVGKDWGAVWDKMQREGISSVDAVEDRINALVDKRREVTIEVNEVVKKKTGGIIHKFARGALLGGYGGGDRIPALLEAGEGVLRKEAVRWLGSKAFYALNNLQWPKFQSGGISGGDTAAAGAGMGDFGSLSLNLGGRPVRVLTSKSDAMELARQFKKLEKYSS